MSTPGSVVPVFWDALSEDERHALAAGGLIKRFPAGGRPLMTEGAGSTEVMILMAGWVKVVGPTGSGREVVLAVRGPGDIVGEISAMFDRPRSATVYALTEVEVLVIPAARFLSFLERHPRAWWPLTATIIGRVDDLDTRLRVHAEGDGTVRLAHLLVFLCELTLRYRDAQPDGSVTILPPLSQAEIGSWLDVSRETAARAFGVLRAKGIVATAYRKITVLDLPALRALAHQNL